MNSNYRQSLGKWGEGVALQFLEEQGLSLVVRNFRSPEGEIDLIMLQNDQLVVVEVKTRKDIEFGVPEEAVTDEKIEHISASAEYFLQQNPLYDENWRIDVISIIGTPLKGDPQIDWFENVS